MNKKLESLLIRLKDLNQDKLNDFLTILDDMELGDENKISGLLDIGIVNKIFSFDDVKDNYDEKIIKDLEILMKIDAINYAKQESEAENLRKMFFTTTKDIRIIMTKIAIVVVNLRFDTYDDEKAILVANTIFYLFAPLSARLGLSKYKTELENSAFKLSNPKLYDEIQQEVDNRFHKRQPIVDRLTIMVENCLKELNIIGRVYGRKKHIYSIYKKMKDHTLDNMYDLIAVRAIVPNVNDCYALLGRLHSIIEPYKNRFKDYIATPKPNGYQSLHTTLKFEGFPVEVQIRTEEMHRYAEYGIAAHWLYKEKRSKQSSLDTRLSWIRQMMENENISVDELAESLEQDLYNSEIYVQTPMGKVIYLPKGSTTIDFAYAIHSEVGNKCVGAKVNGKMVPTTSILNNADVVEIITNPNSKGPSKDWLKIVKTSEARSKINSFFKKNMREETIKLGKTMLENAIRDKGYSVNKLMSQDSFDDIVAYYNMPDIDDFYINIGTNAISAKLIANKLATSYQKLIKQTTSTTPVEKSINISTPTEKQVALKDLNNVMVSFANCCHPMYGDDIIGFISAGRGVVVHRKICPNVQSFSHHRLIDVNWNPIESKNGDKK